MPAGQREELAPQPDRHRPAGGVLKRQIRVNELRTIPDEQILELGEIAAHDVPADQSCAGGSKCVNGPEIPRAVEDYRVVGIDETSSEQIQALLRAGKN